MENEITFYIINDSEDKLQRCINSLPDNCIVHIIKNVNDFSVPPETCLTEWYCYIYSGEYFSGGLKHAMPLFILSKKFDIMILLQRIEVSNECKYFAAPRVFRKEIILEHNSMLPLKGIKSFSYERILDGWLGRD